MKSILAFALRRNSGRSGGFASLFRRLALVLLVAFGATGCSTINFAYSTGPIALGFIADSYLDLDAEQETVLKQRILAVREWNRTTHMAEYARFLAEVRGRVAGKVAPEDVSWAVDEARKRWRVLAERAADDIADIAPQLTADNLAALKKKMARNNAEYVKDVINLAPEKQRERRVKRIREEIERWYGNLEDAQVERLRAIVATLPTNYPLVLEDRKRRQAELLAIFTAAVEKTADRAEIRARMVRALADWEAGRSPAHEEFAARYRTETQRMVAEMVNLTTPAQRDTAQRRAQRWVDDMLALAARKEP